MKVGVVVFPGSNCDHDIFDVCARILGWNTRFLWHKESTVGACDVVILPGGFSYGDYLRAGAIARFSPIMKDVRRFAEQGGTVVGICNGFQILAEAGLLPGALMRNVSVQFKCEDVYVKVKSARSPLTDGVPIGTVLKIPIAHAEGNYFDSPAALDSLGANQQIIFEYCDAQGRVTAQSNPNGSQRNIAGVSNARGNVVGLMPHPERCSEMLLGGGDGLVLFEALARRLKAA